MPSSRLSNASSSEFKPTPTPSSSSSSEPNAILRAEVQRLQVELGDREAELERVINDRNGAISSLKDELQSVKKELDLARARTTNLEEQAKQRAAWHQEELQSVRKKLESENLELKERLHDTTVKERKLEDALKDANEVAEVQNREIDQLSAKLDVFTSQAQESSQAYKLQRQQDERRVKEALVHFTIEKANYLRSLSKGINLVEQLKAAALSIVSKQDDITFRAGRDGVRAWLGSIGLSRQADSFISSGYHDLETLANITEGDLRELRIVGGDRRKLLAHASELRKTHDDWRERGIFDSTPTTASQLLQDLYEWLDEFREMLDEDGTAANGSSSLGQSGLATSMTVDQ
eukprot:PhM_4_TR4188/c0_g1_i1/m.61822